MSKLAGVLIISVIRCLINRANSSVVLIQSRYKLFASKRAEIGKSLSHKKGGYYVL